MDKGFVQLKISFYAPLKPPNHPVPSGDRQMARQLMRALRLSGHDVRLASELRVFLTDSSPAAFEAARLQAKAEIDRLEGEWQLSGSPHLWFCYHPYYKAPDLLGPELCRAARIAYVTAEASWSERRGQGAWAAAQGLVVDAIGLARVNICFTARDRAGLQKALPSARVAMLAPFIDTSPFETMAPIDTPARLVTIAMMRAGDKFESYRMLSAALAGIQDLPWTLTVVGDGKLRSEVQGLFANFPERRIDWLGEADAAGVAKVLCRGGIYVWPGCGEAYGLSYLEAQAAGLPVVAQNTAGVPEVVCHGETGLLTPAGDVQAFAEAIKWLLCNGRERVAMAAAARRFVLGNRSLGAAALGLDDLLLKAADTR